MPCEGVKVRSSEKGESKTPDVPRNVGSRAVVFQTSVDRILWRICSNTISGSHPRVTDILDLGWGRDFAL